MKSVVFGLCVPVAFVLVASGCSSTTNNVYSDGGTPLPGSDASTPTTDSGDSGSTGTGVLGFHPSNLGALLEGLDLSMLVDIDVTTVGMYASLACGSQSNNGCLVKTVKQADGSSAAVYIAKSWKIEPTGELLMNDKTPMILVALDTIDVLGKITSTASSFSAYGGGFAGASGTQPGAGPGGGGAEHDMAGAPVGGGGARHCGVGGKGGNGSGTFGLCGATYGSAAIVPLHFEWVPMARDEPCQSARDRQRRPPSWNGVRAARGPGQRGHRPSTWRCRARSR